MIVSIVGIVAAALLLLIRWIIDEVKFRRFMKHWSKEPEGYSKYTDEQRNEYITRYD